jgi:hypothetical protein
LIGVKVSEGGISPTRVGETLGVKPGYECSKRLPGAAKRLAGTLSSTKKATARGGRVVIIATGVKVPFLAKLNGAQHGAGWVGPVCGGDCDDD